MQTTSGKIARKWNKQAYLTFEADATSPWHATKAAILKMYRESGGADAGLGEGIMGEGGLSAGSTGTGTGGVLPPGGPASHVALEGAELRTQLQKDVAAYMRVAPAQVVANVGLIDLGVDSLSLSQIAGMFRHQYGFNLKDEHMFADGLSIDWLVSHAAPLRSAAGDVPPHSGGEGGGGARAVAEVGAMPLRPAGTQPSWIQRNCPCCVCLY